MTDKRVLQTDRNATITLMYLLVTHVALESNVCRIQVVEADTAFEGSDLLLLASFSFDNPEQRLLRHKVAAFTPVVYRSSAGGISVPPVLGWLYCLVSFRYASLRAQAQSTM